MAFVELGFSSDSSSGGEIGDDRPVRSSERSSTRRQPMLLKDLKGSITRKRLSQCDERLTNKKLKSTLPTHRLRMDDKNYATSVTGSSRNGTDVVLEGQDERCLDPTWEVIDSWEGDDSHTECENSQGLSRNCGFPMNTSSLDTIVLSDEENELDFFSCGDLSQSEENELDFISCGDLSQNRLIEVSGLVSEEESNSFCHSNIQPQRVDAGSSPSVSRSLPPASSRIKLKKMQLILSRVDRRKFEIPPFLPVRIPRSVVNVNRTCFATDALIDSSLSNLQVDDSVSDTLTNDNLDTEDQSLATSQCKSYTSPWKDEIEEWNRAGMEAELVSGKERHAEGERKAVEDDSMEEFTGAIKVEGSVAEKEKSHATPSEDEIEGWSRAGMETELVTREEGGAKGEREVVQDEDDGMEGFTGAIKAEGPVGEKEKGQCKSFTSHWEDEIEGWSRAGMEPELVTREEGCARGERKVVESTDDDMEEFTGAIKVEGLVPEKGSSWENEKSASIDVVKIEDSPDENLAESSDIDVIGGTASSPAVPSSVDEGNISNVDISYHQKLSESIKNLQSVLAMNVESGKAQELSESEEVTILSTDTAVMGTPCTSVASKGKSKKQDLEGEDKTTGVSRKRKKHKKCSHRPKRRKTTQSLLELEVSPSSLTKSARNYFVRKAKMKESSHVAKTSSHKKSKHCHKLYHKHHDKFHIKARKSSMPKLSEADDVNYTINEEEVRCLSADGDRVELPQPNEQQMTKRKTKQERLKKFVKYNMKRIKHLIGSYSRKTSTCSFAVLSLVDKACQTGKPILFQDPANGPPPSENICTYSSDPRGPVPVMSIAVQTGHDSEEREATGSALAVTQSKAVRFKNKAVVAEAGENLWLYYNPSRAKTSSRCVGVRAWAGHSCRREIPAVPFGKDIKRIGKLCNWERTRHVISIENLVKIFPSRCPRQLNPSANMIEGCLPVSAFTPEFQQQFSRLQELFFMLKQLRIEPPLWKLALQLALAIGEILCRVPSFSRCCIHVSAFKRYQTIGVSTFLFGFILIEVEDTLQRLKVLLATDSRILAVVEDSIEKCCRINLHVRVCVSRGLKETSGTETTMAVPSSSRSVSSDDREIKKKAKNMLASKLQMSVPKDSEQNSNKIDGKVQSSASYQPEDSVIVSSSCSWSAMRENFTVPSIDHSLSSNAHSLSTHDQSLGASPSFVQTLTTPSHSRAQMSVNTKSLLPTQCSTQQGRLSLNRALSCFTDIHRVLVPKKQLADSRTEDSTLVGKLDSPLLAVLQKAKSQECVIQQAAPPVPACNLVKSSGQLVESNKYECATSASIVSKLLKRHLTLASGGMHTNAEPKVSPTMATTCVAGSFDSREAVSVQWPQIPNLRSPPAPCSLGSTCTSPSCPVSSSVNPNQLMSSRVGVTVRIISNLIDCLGKSAQLLSQPVRSNIVTNLSNSILQMSRPVHSASPTSVALTSKCSEPSYTCCGVQNATSNVLSSSETVSHGLVPPIGGTVPVHPPERKNAMPAFNSLVSQGHNPLLVADSAKLLSAPCISSVASSTTTSLRSTASIARNIRTLVNHSVAPRTDVLLSIPRSMAPPVTHGLANVPVTHGLANVPCDKAPRALLGLPRSMAPPVTHSLASIPHDTISRATQTLASVSQSAIPPVTQGLVNIFCGVAPPVNKVTHSSASVPRGITPHATQGLVGISRGATRHVTQGFVNPFHSVAPVNQVTHGMAPRATQSSACISQGNPHVTGGLFNAFHGVTPAVNQSLVSASSHGTCQDKVLLTCTEPPRSSQGMVPLDCGIHPLRKLPPSTSSFAGQNCSVKNLPVFSKTMSALEPSNKRIISTTIFSIVTPSTTTLSSTITPSTTILSSTITPSTSTLSFAITPSNTTLPSTLSSTTLLSSTVKPSTTTLPSTLTSTIRPSTTLLSSKVKPSTTTLPSTLSSTITSSATLLSSTVKPSTTTLSCTTIPTMTTLSSTTTTFSSTTLLHPVTTFTTASTSIATSVLVKSAPLHGSGTSSVHSCPPTVACSESGLGSTLAMTPPLPSLPTSNVSTFSAKQEAMKDLLKLAECVRTSQKKLPNLSPCYDMSNNLNAAQKAISDLLKLSNAAKENEKKLLTPSSSDDTSPKLSTASASKSPLPSGNHTVASQVDAAAITFNNSISGVCSLVEAHHTSDRSCSTNLPSSNASQTTAGSGLHGVGDKAVGNTDSRTFTITPSLPVGKPLSYVLLWTEAMAKQCNLRIPPPSLHLSASYNPQEGLQVKWSLIKQLMGLQWSMRQYYLLSMRYDETKPVISASCPDWSLVGGITPLSLPMTVTLTHFHPQRAYWFMVRGKMEGEDSLLFSNIQLVYVYS